MVSGMAETAMWVLIGMSIAVIVAYLILNYVGKGSEFIIPSIVSPWQNAALQLIGVLLVVMTIIYFSD